MQDIIVLSLKFDFGDSKEIIHPVVLRDDKNTVLFDCGYSGHLNALKKALKNENIKLQDLTYVAVTHHDYDHIGCLSQLKIESPKTKILSSEKEAAYIEGRRKSLRLQQTEILRNMLPDNKKDEADLFIKILKNIQPVKVDEIIKQGDIIPVCGGCVAIDTPGHTAGHMSFYIKNSSVVIAGDAACKSNDMLTSMNTESAFDKNKASASFDKLLSLNADNYICYHGGVYSAV